MSRRLLLYLFLFGSYVSIGQIIDPVKNFPLKNVDGKQVSLSDNSDAKGFILIFTCNHCPFAKLYPPRLNALHRKFKVLGVPLLAISSTDTVEYEEDGFLQMAEKARREKFEFPYLMDGKQALAQQFGAHKTPHAFVIWKEQDNWQIRYDGAIDDNGARPDLVKKSYVQDAVDSLLSGHQVKIPKTASIGCQIYFRRPLTK